MADINIQQNLQKDGEQEQMKQLKKSILEICEPMCRKIMKEKPKDISSFMINWLQDKYNFY